MLWPDAGRTCTTSHVSSRLAKSDFYTDLRSARPQVEGTVARGQLHEDTYFYTGKVGERSRRLHAVPGNGEVLATRPASVSIFIARLVIRGLAMATAWSCSVAFSPPPSYHTDRLRKAPLGYFFEVMTNGFGAMPDYAAADSAA